MACHRHNSSSAAPRRIWIGTEGWTGVDRQKVGINRSVYHTGDAPFGFSIGSFAFSIRNTMRRSARSVISTLSPVSRIRLGMSITDSGSVQCTSRKSPGVTAFNALRVFSAGSGHFRPQRSSFVVVMLRTWRKAHASSTDGAVMDGFSDQACIGQEPDRLPGLNESDLLA